MPDNTTQAPDPENSARDAQALLRGVRIIDVSDSVAGQYCARLLADAGADVVLVEAPTGSSTRWQGPFWRDAHRPEDSILFWHLNAAKRSVTLDLEQRTGRRLFNELVAESDAVVASRLTPRVKSLVESAEAAARRPWFCWVDEFEEKTTFADWRGSELIHQAMSGVMFENGAPDERPLYGVGRRSYYATGTAAYVAAVAAIYARRRGQVVDSARISVSEVAPSMNHCSGTQYWYNGTKGRRGAQISPTMMIKCADGWVVTFPSAARWAATCRAFGAAELISDPRFAEESDRLHRWAQIQAALQASTSARSCEQVIAAAARENAIVTRVASPSELHDDAHLLARGFWQQTDDGHAARPALGPVFKSAGRGRPRRIRAPLLGEHTASVLADLGVSEDEYVYLRNLGMV